MDDGIPGYLFIVLIILIMIFNALVVACKRALDYIDRNVIKERLEDEPEDKSLITVTDFLAKPSKYHYADHSASFISIIVCFMLFNAYLMTKGIADTGRSDRVGWLFLVLYNLGFYILYTALAEKTRSAEQRGRGSRSDRIPEVRLLRHSAACMDMQRHSEYHPEDNGERHRC